MDKTAHKEPYWFQMINTINRRDSGYVFDEQQLEKILQDEEFMKHVGTCTDNLKKTLVHLGGVLGLVFSPYAVYAVNYYFPHIPFDPQFVSNITQISVVVPISLGLVHFYTRLHPSSRLMYLHAHDREYLEKNKHGRTTESVDDDTVSPNMH